MSNRSKVEKAFRSLTSPQRAAILTSWGFAAFADLPDSVLEGVSNDIRDANPAAFGTVKAQRTTKPQGNTASQLAGMADGIFAKANAKGSDGDQPATGNFFEGAAAVIDAAEIYDRYNTLSAKVKAARTKQPDA